MIRVVALVAAAAIGCGTVDVAKDTVDGGNGADVAGAGGAGGAGGRAPGGAAGGELAGAAGFDAGANSSRGGAGELAGAAGTTNAGGAPGGRGGAAAGSGGAAGAGGALTCISTPSIVITPCGADPACPLSVCLWDGLPCVGSLPIGVELVNRRCTAAAASGRTQCVLECP